MYFCISTLVHLHSTIKIYPSYKIKDMTLVSELNKNNFLRDLER